MQIVGVETTDHEGARVHTIDVWYSRKRKVWLVERLDGEGHQIGLTYVCDDEQDAAVCLAEWLRAHGETHLVAPRETSAAERRILAGRPQRRAA